MCQTTPPDEPKGSREAPERYRLKRMSNSIEALLRQCGITIDPSDAARAEQLAKAERALLSELLRIRKANGLTQQQVADRMGVRQSTVAKLEAPDGNPTLSTIRRYANAVRALVVYKVEADRGQLQDSGKREFWLTAKPTYEITIRRSELPGREHSQEAGEDPTPFRDIKHPWTLDTVSNTPIRTHFALAA